MTFTDADEAVYQLDATAALDYAGEMVEQGRTRDETFLLVVDFCAGGSVAPYRDPAFVARLDERIAAAQAEFVL